MLFLRICFDAPGKGELRNQFREKHRAYLKPFIAPGQSVHLVQAGPMCVSDDDDTNLGSFMIVEADSIAQVQAFHEGDPFTLEGVFGRVDICRWDRHIG